MINIRIVVGIATMSIFVYLYWKMTNQDVHLSDCTNPSNRGSHYTASQNEYAIRLYPAAGGTIDGRPSVRIPKMGSAHYVCHGGNTWVSTTEPVPVDPWSLL